MKVLGSNVRPAHGARQHPTPNWGQETHTAHSHLPHQASPVCAHLKRTALSHLTLKSADILASPSHTLPCLLFLRPTLHLCPAPLFRNSSPQTFCSSLLLPPLLSPWSNHFSLCATAFPSAQTFRNISHFLQHSLLTPHLSAATKHPFLSCLLLQQTPHEGGPDQRSPCPCPPVPSLSLESNRTFTLFTEIHVIITKDLLSQLWVFLSLDAQHDMPDQFLLLGHHSLGSCPQLVPVIWSTSKN